MKEIRILDTGNETYEKSNSNLEEIIQDNLENSTHLKLSNGSKDKSLPIMYWIPKLHKIPVCSQLLKIVQLSFCSKQFPMYLNLFKLTKFLSNYNKFWVLQNVDFAMENISIFNRKKKPKSVATYDFSTLCTTLPHDKLIKRLCNFIDFVFEGGNRTLICISKSNSAYWGK